jgi:hypothetical protein
VIIMAIELPDQLTPLTPDEAARYLAEAYRLATGKLPSPQVLTLLVAQWAGETGNGKYTHCFNFGNVKKSKSSTYFCQFPCGENDRVTGKSVMHYPPDPVCHFAAYPSAQDGANAYVNQLKRRSNWWAGLETGNVSDFVDALAEYNPSKGIYAYFTAPKAAYLKLVADRAAKFAPLGQKYGSTLLVAGVVGGSAWLAYGAIGAGVILGYELKRRAKTKLAKRT